LADIFTGTYGSGLPNPTTFSTQCGCFAALKDAARADEGVLVNISHHRHGGSLQPHFDAMGTLVGPSLKNAPDVEVYEI